MANRGSAGSPCAAGCAASRLSTSEQLDSPAWLLYTSGTTGEPKGVLMSQRAAVGRIAWSEQQYELRGGRFLIKTNYIFGAAEWELLWGPVCGGTLVLAPPGCALPEPTPLPPHQTCPCVRLAEPLALRLGASARSRSRSLRSLLHAPPACADAVHLCHRAEKNPRRMLELLGSGNISHLLLVPSALSAMCDWVGEQGFGPEGAPARLRHVLMIGEAFPPRPARARPRRLCWQPCLPSLRWPSKTFANLPQPVRTD